MGALSSAVLLTLQVTSKAAEIGSQIAQSRTAARLARKQRSLAEQAAVDVEQRGAQDIEQYQAQLRQLRGAQRVTGAAQGLALEEGTMQQIAQQTEAIGAEDIRRLRENIRREAFGIRTQAQIDYQAGMAQSRALGIEATGTLLGAAGKGYEWWRSRRPRIPTGQTVMRSPINLPGGAV